MAEIKEFTVGEQHPDAEEVTGNHWRFAGFRKGDEIDSLLTFTMRTCYPNLEICETSLYRCAL